jgi:chemotaxis protein methyltransferase CheR
MAKSSQRGSSLVSHNTALEDLELDLLLDALFHYYGYDFRNYDRRAVKSRVLECALEERLPSISRFQDRVLRDCSLLDRLLQSFSPQQSSMLADDRYVHSLRTKVLPKLRTYPVIRVWYIGCSTGEDVYSLAILLQEEGIYPRCRIYATDLSSEAIRNAKEGRYQTADPREYESNYLRVCNSRPLKEYLSVRGKRLLINPSLKKNILFFEHNLVSDGSFNEFQLILCRDILGNFKQVLRERVDRLIYDSLSRFGILVLGASDSIRLLAHETSYAILDEESRLYQKDDRLLQPASA